MTLGLLLPLRPLDASIDGFRNDALFNTTAVMVSVLFVIVCGILVWSIAMHRQGRHRASYERGIGRRHLVFTALITAVVFVGVDGTLLVDSYLDLDQVLWRFPGPDAHPLEVEVWAQQWAWNVRYAGPDGKFGTPDDVVTLNEMHVPVGRAVVVQLEVEGRGPLVLPAQLPHQAGRRARRRDPPLVRRPGRSAATRSAARSTAASTTTRCAGGSPSSSTAGFDAWMRAAAEVARKAYDEDDVDAHWGWPWIVSRLFSRDHKVIAKQFLWLGPRLPRSSAA